MCAWNQSVNIWFMLLGGDCETNYVSGWQRRKIPLSSSRQRRLQQAVDSVLYSVMELFYGANLKFLSSVSSPKWGNIYFEKVCFPCIPWQTVKCKTSNGSRCHKEDVMVLENGEIIVIQDKGAYYHRQGVWGANAVSSERVLLEICYS